MQEEKLEEAHKFKLWKSHLEKSGLQIKNVEEVYTRRRYNGEVLFSTLMLDASTPEGDKIPPICFLKGEVVCVLICLIDEKTSDKYLLLVKQRRIAEGNYTFEHPAGMVDNVKTAEFISVQEVKEETGIDISEDQLINLCPERRLFPSTGTSDEAMYFFAAELSMPIEKIKSFENKNMGTTYEFEKITTHVYPFLEGHKLINNTNGLLLNYLYLAHVKDWNLLTSLRL